MYIVKGISRVVFIEIAILNLIIIISIIITETRLRNVVRSTCKQFLGL